MIRLTRIEWSKNVSRFYRLQVQAGLFGNWALLREWGRLGQPGTVKTEWFDTQEEAETAKNRLLKKKFQKGYS